MKSILKLCAISLLAVTIPLVNADDTNNVRCASSKPVEACRCMIQAEEAIAQTENVQLEYPESSVQSCVTGFFMGQLTEINNAVLNTVGMDSSILCFQQYANALDADACLFGLNQGMLKAENVKAKIRNARSDVSSQKKNATPKRTPKVTPRRSTPTKHYRNEGVPEKSPHNAGEYGQCIKAHQPGASCRRI